MVDTSKQSKTIIGRGEPVNFVTLGINNVPAKVDTGAYRSAIQASDVRVSDDGKQLSFTLLGGHPVFKEQAQTVTTTSFKQVEVENSFGHREHRYEVTFKVLVGSKTFNTGFTLANRTKKDFPILLGRKLLNKRFIVDTSFTNIDRLALKRRYKEATGVELELK